MNPTPRIRRPPPSPARSLSKLLHKGRMGRIRQPGNISLFTEPPSGINRLPSDNEIDFVSKK
jgi:hypothetical protein